MSKIDSLSFAIIDKKKLSTNKLELFTQVIYNNFIHLKNHKELNHNKKTIHQNLKSENAQVYFILVNNKIASYVVGQIMTLNDTRKVLYITYLYTSEKFRGHGFASKLLDIAERISLKNNLDGIMLTYDSENAKLTEFYYNRGFMPDLLLRTYGKYEVLYKT